VHSNIIRRHDFIKFIIGKLLTGNGSSCVFEKPLVADTAVYLKADISTSISDVTAYVDGAIAEATASTHVLVNTEALIHGAACAAADKNARWQNIRRS
jgi:hypothetical protein